MNKIDAITMEVLGNAVLSICEEMGVVLAGTARSTLLRESGDFSCTLHSGDGKLVAQTNTLPALASLARSAILDLGKFVDIPGQAEAGDIYFTNHLLVGGSHLSDVKAMAPLFLEGKIVAWLANCAHWPDVGGAFAGGYVCATDVFQEGLLIPPVRFFRGDQLNEETVSFVLNNVRAPDERLGDIRAQAAAIRRGKLRLEELMVKYGQQTIETFFREYLDYTETRVRHEIRLLPNGVYAFEDVMDNDGIGKDPVHLQVRVEIQDQSMRFDFTGSDPQVVGPINATPAVVLAGVNFAVRGVTDPLIPINEGVYRPLEVIVPEGTWLNAKHPAPRQHCTHETGHRVIDCVLGALAQAVPDRVPAAMHGTSSIMIMSGNDPGPMEVDSPVGSEEPSDSDSNSNFRGGGEFFLFFDNIAGGFGARPDKDGIDGIRTGVGNAANTPVELAEVEFPLTTQRYEFVTDSGGAGKQRGGCGMQRVMKVHGPSDFKVLCVSSAERCVGRPYGLQGGKAAASGRWAANIETENEVSLPGKNNIQLGPGETYSACTPGGGGWGDPLERDPKAVLEDVLEEKVSLESAAKDYGVAIDPDCLDIDWEETDRLRRRDQSARKAPAD